VLQTELAWVGHSRRATEKRSVRATKALHVPEDLHAHIAFLSLNSPVNHAMPRAAKALAQRRKEEREAATAATAGANPSKNQDQHKMEQQQRDRRIDNAMADAAAGLVGISPGNEEALAIFQPFCGLGSTVPNTENPPCQSSAAENQPAFTVRVTRHANNQADPYLLSEEPTVIQVPAAAVYCYNSQTTAACSGTDGLDCMCVTKVSILIHELIDSHCSADCSMFQRFICLVFVAMVVIVFRVVFAVLNMLC
jgi:hypothetical protein